jgi:glycine cleavage system aminomethyltransferase T
VGVITSGTFGPSVGYGIGMAYLPVEMSQPGHVFSAGPKGLRIITTDFPFYKGGSLRD